VNSHASSGETSRAWRVPNLPTRSIPETSSLGCRRRRIEPPLRSATPALIRALTPTVQKACLRLAYTTVGANPTRARLWRELRAFRSPSRGGRPHCLGQTRGGHEGSRSTWGCVLTVFGLNRGRSCAQKGERRPTSGRSSSLTCFVSHVTSPGFCALRNLEIVTEIRRKVAQLVERPRLQLTSPLACYAQFPSYLDERLRRLPR
jgi:hypothetical protein